MDLDPSTHYSLHKALEHEVNAVLPCGESIAIVQSPQYTTTGKGEVLTAGFTVTFTKKACNNFSVHLSWTTPTTRENGDPLPLGEIAGYELVINDKTYPIIAWINKYTVNGLSRGPVVCKIRTLSTDNLVSEWSETVSLILE